jgi:hypothetical protein
VVSGAQVFRLWGWATGTRAPTSRRDSASLCCVLRVPQRAAASRVTAHRCTAAPLHSRFDGKPVVSFVCFLLEVPGVSRSRWGPWGCTLADRAGINPAGPDSASPDPHGCFEIAISIPTQQSPQPRNAPASALMAALGRRCCGGRLPARRSLRTIQCGPSWLDRDGGAAPIRRQLGEAGCLRTPPLQSTTWSHLVGIYPARPRGHRLSPHRCFSSRRRCGSSLTRRPSLYCEFRPSPQTLPPPRSGTGAVDRF